MHTYRQVPNCKTAGPFGGGGGWPFSVVPSDCDDQVVTQIVVGVHYYVSGISVTTRFSNGLTAHGKFYGNTNGGRTETINLKEGEHIVGIFGRSGSLIDQIGFVTDQGRVYGPYGTSGGKEFNVYDCNLRGVSGRVGDSMDSIGFYCGKSTC